MPIEFPQTPFGRLDPRPFESVLLVDSFSTISELKALMPRSQPYEARDTQVTGGYVRVLQSGNFSYVLRYKFRKKSHKLFLGRFVADAQGLKTVRLKAREAANDLTRARTNPEGVDPVTARQLARNPNQSDLVRNIVNEFIEHYAKPRQRDWRESERLLNKEMVSRWGDRSFSSLSSSEVRASIREIAKRAPVGANRTLACFKKLCNWAIEQELIPSTPIVNIRAPTSEKGRSRERVLDDVEIRKLWLASEKVGYPFDLIVQMLILTGQRRGEVSGMSWDEINIDKKVWTIPVRRSKNGKAHAVPLTKPCVDIIKSLPRHSREAGSTDFLFSPKSVPPAGFTKFKNRLDKIIAGDGQALEPYVLHDIRRSVATGMARLGIALPVVERCLNHTSGSFSGIVGVYQRHSFTEEMREALDRWANHIARLIDDENLKSSTPLKTELHTNKDGFDNMDHVQIQVQDISGNWRTYTITQNSSQLILMAMKALKDQFPDQRVRAIDENYRLLDLMA